MKKILTLFSFALLFVFLPLISIHAYTIKDGGLVKGPNLTAVYYTINGGRYAFPTQKTFELYFGNNFWKVELINADELANLPLKGSVLLPDNTLIKIQSIPKVYKIITTGGIKTLEWIATEQDAINQFGNDWAKSVIDVSDVYFIDYQSSKLAIEMKDYYGGLNNTNTASNTSTIVNNNTNTSTAISGCTGDYVWNPDKTACVTRNDWCVAKYGLNNYFTGEYNSAGNFLCGCTSGYNWNSTKTSCIISYDQSCQNKYGNSYSTGLDSAGTNICDCSNGYKWNSTKTSCIISYDQACQDKYGTYSYSKIVNSDGTNTCGCNTGYTFNATKTSCISFDEYCKITFGADYYYKADQNMCLPTSLVSASTCDQMWAKYLDYSTGVQYSDPIYFAARDMLKVTLSQYCGMSLTTPGSNTTTSLPIAMGGVTSDIINGTTYYNFGNGLTGTRDTINGITYYKYSNGLTGTQNTINGITYYKYSNGLTGTSNTINGTTYNSFSNGLSGTINTINGITYYKYNNGTSYSCNLIGTTTYCN